MSDCRSRAQSRRPVHPRDASSVVLLRGSKSDPEVLLGRRRLDARFMPGIYVFPGGRVDRADYRHAASAAIRKVVLEKLARHCPAGRARALIWAALRETWEESGLLIGQPGRIGHDAVSDLHSAYADAGLAPKTDGLDYVSRAITPVRNPIRFNTRFFLIDGANAFGSLRHNSELEDIGWRPVSEALSELDLMNVTSFALEEAMKLWRKDAAPNSKRLVARLTTRVNTKLITFE